jgi:hypothetical protein
MLGRAMAEWAILLVLVPAIVVPVVLLLGFAGCFSRPPLRSQPMILSARATSRTSIRIDWSYSKSGATSFEIELTRVSDAFVEGVTAPSSPFEITGLAQATAYSFRVRALHPDDDDNSFWSMPVEASTFGQSFLQTYVPGVASDVMIDGSTLILRIEPSRLARSGSQIALTLTGPSAGATSIDRIYVSQPAGGAADPYDAAADLTRVTDVNSGDPVVVVGANDTRQLPPVSYNLDESQPLLVAIDITQSPLAQSAIRAQPVPTQDGVTYARTIVEAAVADRTTGYSENGIFFILSGIDVA